MFDANKKVLRRSYTNKFIEFDLNGGIVAILRILDEKHHKESNDRSSRIDHQLPRIGILKDGATCCPNYNDEHRSYESTRSPGGGRYIIGD